MAQIADRKGVRALEKASRIALAERADVLRAITATPQGRAYLWAELEAAQVFNSVFSTEPLLMAFNEGNRNAGLRLLTSLLETCPDQFILMMQERNANAARERINADESAGSSDRGGGDQEPDPADGDDHDTD